MTLLDAPHFDFAAVIAIVRERYGFDATPSPLPSERDQNFHIRAAHAEFVLKIANAQDDIALLRAQNAAMAHAAASGARCPTVVADLHGETLTSIVAPTGATHWIRLVTWLPGTPLGVSPDRSRALLGDIGRRVGELDRALATFDDPAIHRDFYWDLAKARSIVDEHRALVTDREIRAIVDETCERFDRDTAPLLPMLRRSTIHNDANEYNVLVERERVSGIIDFGDLVYGWTVGDLAIAIAYAVLDREDPIEAAAIVARSYESEYALRDEEHGALLGLVRLRLAVSICVAEFQRRQRPDDDYLTISQQPIRRTLPRLLK